MDWTAFYRALVVRVAQLVMLLGVTPTPGCGAPVAECALDGDCDQGQGCEASECTPGCSTDADCLEDEVCLKGTTTELKVCQTAAAGTMANPLDATIALVRDTSTSCGSEMPGADIAFILLEAPDGTVLGWGDVLAADIRGEENAFTSYGHIDGDEPEARADSCPEASPQAVTSLGCEGWIAVQFRGDAGNVVDLTSGLQYLRVGERGAQCDEDDGDQYDVFLCPDATSGDDVPVLCNAPVGTGGGERVFSL